MGTTAKQDTALAETIYDHIVGTIDPEDLYGYDRLREWAEKNGFERPD